jgi:Regulator of chromosome condensation (RCC1) repeat
VPVPVASASGLLTGATALAVGESHACASLGGSGVVCWGSDDIDQLGAVPAPAEDGGVPDFSATPLPVSGVSQATALASGGTNFTCALVGTAVACWGYLMDGLGDAAMTQQSIVPVTIPIPGGGAPSAVSAGPGGACVVYSAARNVACWGALQLGNGATNTSQVPTTVPGQANVEQVAVGADHVCVLLAGGSVSCWGSGENGQLGNGSTAAMLVPTPVVWAPQ